MTTTDKSSSAIENEEKPGWVWVLHVDQNAGDEEDAYAFATVGAYATHAQLLEEVKKLKLENWGEMHILVEGLDAELKEAYSKGASATLEKVKEYVFEHTFALKGQQGLYIDAVTMTHFINSLLSQYKQGVVAHEKHDCQFSGCDKTNAERFYSYEESYVWLCPEHTELNIKKKTGYPEPRGAVEK